MTEQPILSGVSPISFQFAPHNPQLIYIAEKQGTIKVFDLATNAVVATFADLSAKLIQPTTGVCWTLLYIRTSL